MTKARKPAIESQGVAVALGVCSLAFAAWCFRDAYEHRGRERPLAVSILGV